MGKLSLSKTAKEANLIFFNQFKDLKFILIVIVVALSISPLNPIIFSKIDIPFEIKVLIIPASLYVLSSYLISWHKNILLNKNFNASKKEISRYILSLFRNLVKALILLPFIICIPIALYDLANPPKPFFPPMFFPFYFIEMIAYSPPFIVLNSYFKAFIPVIIALPLFINDRQILGLINHQNVSQKPKLQIVRNIHTAIIPLSFLCLFVFERLTFTFSILFKIRIFEWIYFLIGFSTLWAFTVIVIEITLRYRENSSKEVKEDIKAFEQSQPLQKNKLSYVLASILCLAVITAACFETLERIPHTWNEFTQHQEKQYKLSEKIEAKQAEFNQTQDVFVLMDIIKLNQQRMRGTYYYMKEKDMYAFGDIIFMGENRRKLNGFEKMDDDNIALMSDIALKKWGDPNFREAHKTLPRDIYKIYQNRNRTYSSEEEKVTASQWRLFEIKQYIEVWENGLKSINQAKAIKGLYSQLNNLTPGKYSKEFEYWRKTVYDMENNTPIKDAFIKVLGKKTESRDPKYDSEAIIARLDQEIKNGLDISQPDEHENSILYYISQYKYHDLYLPFIERGANIDKNKNITFIWMVQSKYAKAETVQKLIDLGISVNSKYIDINWVENPDVATILFENGLDICNYTGILPGKMKGYGSNRAVNKILVQEYLNKCDLTITPELAEKAKSYIRTH